MVGLAALIANGGVALMLYRCLAVDANMRSVWICSRNDALGNFAVLIAAMGVFWHRHRLAGCDRRRDYGRAGPVGRLANCSQARGETAIQAVMAAE